MIETLFFLRLLTRFNRASFPRGSILHAKSPRTRAFRLPHLTLAASLHRQAQTTPLANKGQGVIAPTIQTSLQVTVRHTAEPTPRHSDKHAAPRASAPSDAQAPTTPDITAVDINGGHAVSSARRVRRWVHALREASCVCTSPIVCVFVCSYADVCIMYHTLKQRTCTILTPLKLVLVHIVLLSNVI